MDYRGLSKSISSIPKTVELYLMKLIRCQDVNIHSMYPTAVGNHDIHDQPNPARQFG